VAKNAGTESVVIASADLKQIPKKGLYLKISAEEVLYSFSYSVDGKNWISVSEKSDGRFLGIDAAGRFTGTMLGMYASSNGNESSNFAAFDWFEYLGK